MNKIIEIRGLSTDYGDENVLDMCEEYGRVVEMRAELQRHYAVYRVTFVTERAARDAIDDLDCTHVDGELLRASFAHVAIHPVGDSNEDGHTEAPISQRGSTPGPSLRRSVPRRRP